jgi:hypothetical protein
MEQQQYQPLAHALRPPVLASAGPNLYPSYDDGEQQQDQEEARQDPARPPSRVSQGHSVDERGQEEEEEEEEEDGEEDAIEANLVDKAAAEGPMETTEPDPAPQPR